MLPLGGQKRWAEKRGNTSKASIAVVAGEKWVFFSWGGGGVGVGGGGRVPSGTLTHTAAWPGSLQDIVIIMEGVVNWIVTANDPRGHKEG